ncbi:amino acid adenylation domain-containing protein [Streptomyces sp. NPDC007856]|uniref:amino acid adenylation domain-containing protein n=1 Tax=Streptomyces sp. NPDC007856 TaxID=3364781 RepID=UPI0036C01317
MCWSGLRFYGGADFVISQFQQDVQAPRTLFDVLRHRALHQPDQIGWTFLADGEQETGRLSYSQLDARARGVAGWLQSRFSPGDRILLLCPSGLDFLAGFLGCFYAGMIAVPVNLPLGNAARQLARIPAILSSAGARCALTTAEGLAMAGDLAAQFPETEALVWLGLDQFDQDEWAERWSPADVGTDDIAFLQYTSGSTAQPKGVMVSHANLMHNCRVMEDLWGVTEGDRIVSWLPLFHDLGLIGNILLSLYKGIPAVFMPPAAFVRSPVRWLDAISRYRGTISMAPNFAFDMCVEKVPARLRERLDLSSWRLAVNGAEPVRAATLDRFTEAFADSGWRAEVMAPSYGLAEATLLVAGHGGHGAPQSARFAKEGLQADRAEPQDDPAVPGRTLVNCSVPSPLQRLAVVDPESRTELPEGRIGEIWVSGSSVAMGYWGLEDETRKVFRATLDGEPSESFLRTGDLGFLHQGALYIAGRLKDLMIVRGQNYYPQDVELAAERSCPEVRPNCSAAFTVTSADEERVVLVAEVRRDADRGRIDAAVEAIRAGVLEETELRLDAVVLIPNGRITKTTSGKIQRGAARDAFLKGELPVIAGDVPERLKREPAADPGQAPAPTDAVVRARAADAGSRDAEPMQFSLLYFSSNAADFAEDKYRLLLEGAKFADEHDFTAVWLPERHFHAFGGLYPNPSVLASALAVATRRIRLRAGSVVLPMHHPVRVAEEWAVVDNLSGGRVDLAFAAGWNPNDFVLAPDKFHDRYGHLFSGIETVKSLWGGGSVELPNGKAEQTSVRIHPAPRQPELRTWLTCSGSPERFAEAGEHGHHVLTGLLFQTVEELAEKIAVYRAARARAGHDPAAGHVTLMLHTFVGDDLDEVRESVRGPFISYLESSVDLWRHGFQRLDEMAAVEREQVLSYAFERYFQSAALFGTPRTCLPFVQSLRAAGVDEIASLIDFGVDVTATLDGLDSLNVLRKRAQRLPARSDGPAGSSAASPPAAALIAAPTVTPAPPSPYATPRDRRDRQEQQDPQDPPEPAEIFRRLNEAVPGARAALLQQYLRERVAQVLERGIDEISRVHSLRGLGLDSLMVVGVMNACQRDLRLVLAPADFHRFTDFAELAEHLAGAFSRAHSGAGPEAGAGRGALELRRRVRTETFPLSLPQQRLWFLEQLAPDTPAYCTPMALRLSGPLEVAALERSLNHVVTRHEALRTAFIDRDGEPCQVVTESQRITVSVTDLRDRPAELRADAALELAAEQARTPFDLARSPLLRAAVYRIAEDDHLLVMVGHHIVIDGWAIKVLFGELAAGYAAALQGAEPELPELPLQYPDFTLWQREWAESQDVAGQLGYWKRQLAGAPAMLELPTDHPRPAVQRFRGRTRGGLLPAELVRAVHGLGKEEGATLFMVLLAAFDVLLARYSGQQDVVVGTPVASRTRPELENLIGFFANTLALRADLTGNPTFRELLGRIRRTCLDAYSHQEVPLELVVDALRPERDLSHQMLFQTLFVLQETGLPDLPLPGIDAKPVALDPGTSRFDLAFSLNEAEDGLHCAVEYNTDLFDDSTVADMLEHYRVLLESAVADPECPVELLEMRTGSERARQEEWNATDLPLPAAGDGLLHRRFERQAALTPDTVALCCGHRQLTYAALNRRANRLARLLRELGVRAETLVGVFLERSADSVAGLLAVLKAGGVHVPLDPSYPPDRLDHMIGDSAVCTLVTTADLAERLQSRPTAVIRLDQEADAARLAGHSPDDLPEDPAPDQLAYIVFTSGSTGRPKGAMMAHRGLVNLVEVERAELQSGHGSRVLQLASLAFDASLWDIVMALPFGGTLCVATGAERVPGDELTRLLTEQAITHATLAPSVLAVLPPSSAPDLRVLTSTGEALRAEVADRWAAGCRLINGYGPTESTVGATIGDCRPGNREPDLGRPFANTRVSVLDPHFRPAPTGVPGEICIGGAGLSRGYLGRPGLTAERFVPDPAGDGARLYRTGDRARFLPDGRLVFLGRSDHQIELRGFRIELGEIEAVLREHRAVRESSVIVTEHTGDGRAADDSDGAGVAVTRLVAYVAAEPGTSAAQLRAHCAERLPDYMLPSAFVVLDALPLTPNGKLDRRALPAPDATPQGSAGGYEPPRSDEERKIAEIWEGLLGLARVGRSDNFFELGGDSILSLRMVARAVEAGLALTTRMVFRHRTVAELAAAVGGDARVAGTVGATHAALLEQKEVDRLAERIADLEEVYPATPLQQGMLFHSLADPESAVYRVQLALRLEGALDPGALRTAWERTAQRHAVLRTSFHRSSQGEPVQVVHRSAVPAWTDLDWRDEKPGNTEPADRLAELAERERATPLGLDTPPLRITLVRLEDEAWHLVWTVHHALLDGWSLPIVLSDMLALYEAIVGGSAAALPRVRPYRDFVEWLGRQEPGAAEQVWRRVLGDFVEPTPLPWHAPVRLGSGVGSVVREAPAGLAGRLRELSERSGVTVGTVLQAAWGVLMARHSGSQDVVFGVTVSGRPPELRGVEGMVGLFINTLPVRLRLAPGTEVETWLREVQELLLELREHEHVPLTQVKGWSGVPQGRPLFETLVVVENHPVSLPGADPAGPDRVLVRDVSVADETDVALTLVAVPDGDRIGLRLQFDAMRYDEASAERLLAQLETVLEGLCRAPAQSLGSIGLMDGSGEQRQRAVLNPRRRTFGSVVAPVVGFAKQARVRPDAVALVSGDRQWTYRMLLGRAHAVAERLREAGVTAESLCAVLLERSVHQVAAVVGVQLAGGAYVPLDTAQPAERLAYVVRDSGCRVLVATRALARRIPAEALHDVRVVLLDEDGAVSDRYEPAPAEIEVHEHQLAYAIYTSGSTGAPKGVLVEHAQVARLFAAAQERRAFGSDEVWSLFHSMAFDFSVWELWGALLHGARLVLVGEDERRDPDRTARLLRAQGVTVLSQTPSAFAPLTEALGDRPTSLRTVVFGGEALVGDRFAQWAASLGGRCPELVNMYGITETTVHVTHHALTGDDLAPRAPSAIGRPLGDLSVYLLDDNDHQVPAGVAAEIHVAGPGVTRGYLNRPGQTADRFRPDPFSSAPGARLYRTGDLARANPDGTLVYLGRTDQQIKLRGYRIEPGEIEHALRTCPAIADAHVRLREDSPGDRKLTAYLVPAPGADGSGTKLITEARAHLAAALPPYMIPAAFVVLPAIPLTSNGKIDTHELPAPAGDRLGVEAAYEEPRGTIETRLAQLWSDMLHVSPIGRGDSFFRLGGDSLLVTVLQSRIQSEFGADVPLRTVFTAPDLAALAAEIGGDRSGSASAGQSQESEGAGERAAAIPALAPHLRQGGLPLSSGQRRFWFLEQWATGTPLYHISGALRLTGELDVAALRGSLDGLVRRHESLRTHLVEADGEGRQVVLPPYPAPLPVLDLSGLAPEQRAGQAERAVRTAAEALFRINGGRLWRFALVRTGVEEHRLVVCLHHLIADGQSLSLLLTELGEDYGTLRSGKEVSRSAPRIQYGDYTEWQRERLACDALRPELEYWRERLADVADPNLPTELPRPEEQSHDSAVHEIGLPEETARGVEELGRRANATPFMVLFAAAAVAVGQHRELTEVVMGTPVAGRSRPELAGMIGYLSNTLVLRLRVAGCAKFGDLLSRAREVCLGAYEHAEVPFDQVVHELRPNRVETHLPLFQTWFVVQEDLGVETAFEGLRVEAVGVTPSLARYDLRVEFRRSPRGLRLVCEYKTALFSAAGIGRLTHRLAGVLAAAVDRPDIPLDELAERLDSAEEARQTRAEAGAAAYSATALQRRRRRGCGGR